MSMKECEFDVSGGGAAEPASFETGNKIAPLPVVPFIPLPGQTGHDADEAEKYPYISRNDLTFDDVESKCESEISEDDEGAKSGLNYLVRQR